MVLCYKGVEVFKRKEIPEELHWKDSKYCPPILILAKPGVVIEKASGNIQKPPVIMPASYDIYTGIDGKPGISGYDPEERDMRGVFMARGPGKFGRYYFRRDITESLFYPHIYQINNRQHWLGTGTLCFCFDAHTSIHIWPYSLPRPKMIF